MAFNFVGAKLVSDRVYRLSTGKFAVRCQRNKYHDQDKPFIKVVLTKRDGEDLIRDHDNLVHRAAAVTARPAVNVLTIEVAWQELLEGQFERNGNDPETIKDYERSMRRLLEYPPFVGRDIATITKQDAEEYLRFRRTVGAERGGEVVFSKGDRHLKELSLLERMSGVRTPRPILTFSVAKEFRKGLKRSAKANKERIVYYPPATVQKFLDALTGRAYVFALLKWLTGMRDIEIQTCRVSDVHLSEDGDSYVEFTPHNKQEIADPNARDWRSLGELHVEVFRRYIEGRDPDAWLFPAYARSQTKGEAVRVGPATKKTFQKDFGEAATKAGIFHLADDRRPKKDEPWQGIKWMRHSRSTLFHSLEGEGAISWFDREQAAKDAARSIGTSLRVFMSNYRVEELKKEGADIRTEVERHRRDARLIEKTVTSDASKVSGAGSRMRGTRTDNVLRILQRDPSQHWTAPQVAAECGATTELEIQKYRTLMSSMAAKLLIRRYGRGLYGAGSPGMIPAPK